MAKTPDWQATALLAVLLVPLVLGACSSVPRYRYAPNPVDHFVPSDESVAHVLIAVVGALEAEHAPGGLELQVRLRVENLGDRPVEIEHEKLELVTANLVAFGAPRVEPAPPVVVDVGGDQLVELYFPFPDVDRDELDMSGLNLRLVLGDGARQYMVGTNFERLATSSGPDVMIGTSFLYAR